jgi:hypothetical protein
MDDKILTQVALVVFFFIMAVFFLVRNFFVKDGEIPLGIIPKAICFFYVVIITSYSAAYLICRYFG